MSLPAVLFCVLSPWVQSNKKADSAALLRLLSPSGELFRAMHHADADGSTQFFFPKERLPTHTQVRCNEVLVWG